MRQSRIALAVALASAALIVQPAAAQKSGSDDAPASGRMILDRPVKGGGLMLFRSWASPTPIYMRRCSRG